MKQLTEVMDFVTWLNNELNKRNWTRAELSRRTGVNQSTFSLIYSGQRKPGPEVCREIARALKIPESTVFQMAGLMVLPDRREMFTDIIVFKLSQLTHEQLDEVMAYIDFIIERDERKEKYQYRHSLNE